MISILPGAIGIVIVLLIGPTLRDAFNFGPLHSLDFVVATMAGFASVTWFEIYKRRVSR